MKRSQSVVAALSVALIAAGVVDSSSAASPKATTLTGGLDLTKVQARLQAAGLNDDQILEVTTFLALDRVGQLTALRTAGFTDPGGDVTTDADAADFLLGQYMVKRGIYPARGIQLQLRSGKLKARAAIDLAQGLKPEDIEVSATEMAQQSAAAGGLTEADALLQGRLQRVATLLRQPLEASMPNFAELWVDRKAKDGAHLVVATAGPPEEVGKAVGQPDNPGRPAFAGLPIEVRRVKYSATTLRGLSQSVRRDLAADLPGQKFVVSTDTVNSVVRVQSNDAATDKRVRGNAKVKERVAAGDVVVDTPQAMGPSSIVGGHGTGSGCKWGFTVQYNSGTQKGLVSAGHCTGGGYDAMATTLVNEWTGGKLDVELQTFDSSRWGDLDNAVERPGLANLDITSRTSWESTNYNDVVCHSGFTHSCGYVTDKNVAPWWVPSPGSFVRVMSPVMVEQPGDSGGPWYYGNSAYGIHSGGCGCFGDYTTWGSGVYGAINYAESSLGFTVLTK